MIRPSSSTDEIHSPARLHQVLRAIHQLQTAISIDYSHIAGAQPTVGEFVTGLTVVVVGARDPGTTHLEFSKRRVIPGHFLATLHIDHAELNPRQRRSLACADTELFFRRQVQLMTSQLTERC